MRSKHSFYRVVRVMSFFNGKKDMFNHRAKRVDEETERYTKRKDTKKENWAREQAKEHCDKTNTYKGQDGR